MVRSSVENISKGKEGWLGWRLAAIIIKMEPKPVDPKPTTLEPVVSRLEKFILYETHSYFYIVGSDKRQREYRVIKLDRKVLFIISGNPFAVLSAPMNTHSRDLHPLCRCCFANFR